MPSTIIIKNVWCLILFQYLKVDDRSGFGCRHLMIDLIMHEILNLGWHKSTRCCVWKHDFAGFLIGNSSSYHIISKLSMYVIYVYVIYVYVIYQECICKQFEYVLLSIFNSHLRYRFLMNTVYSSLSYCTTLFLKLHTIVRGVGNHFGNRCEKISF